MRKVRRILFLLILALFLSIFVVNVWVVKSTEKKVYSDSSSLPEKRVALVLGTSHRTVKGKPNPFFEKRMETAAHLYHEGKVSHFILSGDNRTQYYNEPMTMKRALVSKGVPENVITLDYAGLRTLDSIVRSKAVFGQEKIIIITQPFHCYRALFISDFYDIDAIAMEAAEPDFEETPSVRIREYFARAKAVLDLYILQTSPRFLGQKEELIIQK
jgi:SanA protein